MDPLTNLAKAAPNWRTFWNSNSCGKATTSSSVAKRGSFAEGGQNPTRSAKDLFSVLSQFTVRSDISVQHPGIGCFQCGLVVSDTIGQQNSARMFHENRTNRLTPHDITRNRTGI